MARKKWKLRAKWHSIMEYSAFPFDEQARSRPRSRPHISARSRRIHRSDRGARASQGLNMTLALEGFVPASERCFEASSNVDIAANFRHPVWRVMGTKSTVDKDQQASRCCGGRRCCCAGPRCCGGVAHIGRGLYRIRLRIMARHSTRLMMTILSRSWCN